MTEPRPGLHALIHQWVEARARWRTENSSWEAPQPLVLDQFGTALDALRHHGPDVAWERELSTLPPDLDRELRRWRFHSPDVHVDPSTPSGLPFSQTWWVPFALWDDEAFEESSQAVALPPALLKRARASLDDALAMVRRLAHTVSSPSWRASLDAGAPLDADLIGHREPPKGDADFWPPERLAPLRLQRRQKWLNAGLLPLTLRAASSSMLAWIGVWVADCLAKVHHGRGLMGIPGDLHTALLDAGLLRWDLWSRELLARARIPGSSLALGLTVVRWNGSLVEVRGVAREEQPERPADHWKGRVSLFEEPSALARALSPWLVLDNPSVQIQIRTEEDPVFAAAWQEPFDVRRHRIH